MWDMFDYQEGGLAIGLMSVLYGVVWCGMVWCGVVCCSVMWCGVV